MKATRIICIALAGTFGLSSIATAQVFGPGNGRGDRAEQRQERREARQERREARQEMRQERRQQRQAIRQDRQENRAYRQGYQAGVRSTPNYVYTQPRYVVTQPSYTYTQPRYYSQPRFYRGGYVPYEYRSHQYYVNDWNAYPGLYAPPSGHQWMNVGGEFLLVALATGLIANLLTN